MEENINSKEEHNKPADTPGRKDPQNDKSEDKKSPAETDKIEPTETTNQSKSQETIPKGENSTQKESLVDNPKFESHHMEIHHPHHGHHEKKWKDYLFEFLMLFLAISAGFFVENQREHYIEHLREKQYARSLYDDLKIDTAVIQRVINYKEWSSAKMDSLLRILDSPDILRHNELIYFFERIMTVNDAFTSQDLTYQQLQGSGNFRYFDNQDLYKQISDYYNLYNRYQNIIEDQFEDPSGLTEMEARLFKGSDLASMHNPSPTNIHTLFIRPAKKLHPVKQDQYYLNYFYIKTANRYDLLEGSITWLNWLKDKANKIIIVLQEEYHLE